MPNHPPVVTLDSWRGLNNKHPEERIPENFLAEATNVDVDAGGALRMRKGYTQVLSGTNCHSLWGDGYDQAFYVDDGTLYRIDPNNTAVKTELTTGLSSDRMSYHRVGSSVYYSNGIDSGVISGDTVREWGIRQPTLQPILFASNGGILVAGTYNVTIRYQSVDGRVSGAAVSTQITIGDNQRINLSGLVHSTDPTVSGIQIFVSTADGETMYYHGTVAVGTSTYIIDSLHGAMVPLDYQFNFPCPGGELINDFNGRLYLARGNVLWYSEPHAFDMWRYDGFIEFEDEITNIMPVDDGIFVTTDKLYFLEGNGPDLFRPREREPYRAAKYTGVEIVGGDVVLENIPTGLKWLFTSDKGVVMVGTGGMVFNLTEKTCMIDRAESGAAIFRSKDGINQYVSLLKDPEADRLHFGDSVTADIIRNGIQIT